MAYSYWGRERKLSLLLLKVEGHLHEVGVLTDDGKTFWERWDFENALVFRQEVPLWLKIAMPVAICGAIALFGYSNSTPDAVHVMVKIHVGDDKVIDVGSIFDFGLGNTVHDMWEAEVYALAILIAFFSGAWPYIKLVAMLYTWFAPTKLLSIEKRETWLIVLDALGKWSLVDFFVMVLMLCAFYIQLWVGTMMLVDVTVQPDLGFYTFLLATMMSLGLSHLILACHRLIVEPKVLPIPDALDPKESFANLVYEVKVPHEEEETVTLNNPQIPQMETPSDELVPLANEHRSSSRNSSHSSIQERILCIKFTYAGKLFVGGMIVATAIMVVFGCFYYTMGFEFKGLVGYMLGQDAKVDYSYVSIGTSMPDHSGTPDDFGVRWMQASFFLFGLAMPLGLMTVFMVLWTVPLSLSRQRQLFVLSEVLNAWSTLDVFCCAIAAGLLEIQQFAVFIVGDSCDAINQVLETYFDEKLEGDDKCFDVIAYLKEESWTIFLAAAMMLLVGIPFLRIGNHAIKQRLENTSAEVMETVRRRSRSIGLSCGSSSSCTGNHSLKDEVAIMEDGTAVEKGLVEPLVVKHSTSNDRPSEDTDRTSHNSHSQQTEQRLTEEQPENINQVEEVNNNQNSIPEKKKRSFWHYLSFQHTQYAIVRGCAKLGLIEMHFKKIVTAPLPNPNIGGSSSGSGSGSGASLGTHGNSFSGAFSPLSRSMVLESNRQD